MSQMFAESVGVDFNVGGNFQASLSQMIASTDQYAKSADTMIGKIAGLNFATTALIRSTAGLTQVNKTATAEAAAYQQALSHIEATARITGRSFDDLSKTTLQLARHTGSLSDAVRIVEALGSAGVTSTRSVDQLAKAWSALGTAHGMDPVALGQGLLNLNRQFGASEAQLKSYGDVLTTLSSKFGAGADGILSFSKALAPVAANVGVSQGAIMGLATAATRLGEEGYAGANAFNKIMLDMSHSIRDGTPEIRVYADALGMTTKQLGGLWKQDPTEVIVRFTEAIKRGGPEAARTLEALGLDATRTVRSLQAIAGQGNLRQIIETAQQAYGGGATGKAEQSVLGGVNEQAKQLNETLSQTVAAAGRPFLVFLEAVLKAANGIADVIRQIIQLPIVQWLAPVGAIVRTLGSAFFTTTTVVGLAALVRQLVAGSRAPGGGAFEVTGGLVGGYRRARGAAEFAREGGALAEGAGFAERLGFGYGRTVPEPLFPMAGAGMGPFSLMRAMRGGTNYASMLMDMQARMMTPLTGGNVPYTAAGQLARERMGDIWGVGAGRAGRGFLGEGTDEEGQRPRRSLIAFGEAVQRTAISTGRWGAELAKAESPLKNFGLSLTRLATQTGMGAGVMAGGAIKGIGGIAGALGFTPMGAAITGGIAAAGIGLEAYSSFRKGQEENVEYMRTGMHDANKAFNDFAAAAGGGSRALVDFTGVLKATTEAIAKGNADFAKTFKLSSEQLQQANQPGYQRAFTPTGGITDISQIASQARAVLGPNAPPELVARLGMDVENYQRGAGQKVIDAYRRQLAPSEAYSQAFASVTGTSGKFGQSTDASREFARNVQAQFASDVSATVGVYGTDATNQAAAKEAYKVYAAAQSKAAGVSGGKASAQAAGVAADTIAKGLNLSDDTRKYLEEQLRLGLTPDQAFKNLGAGIPAGAYNPKTGELVRSPTEAGLGNVQELVGTVGVPKLSDEEKQTIQSLPGLAKSSYSATVSTQETATRGLDEKFNKATGKVSGFTDALYGAEQAARRVGKGLDEVDPNTISKAGKAVADYTADLGDMNKKYTAGAALAGVALGSAGGNVQLAIQQLNETLGQTNQQDTGRVNALTNAIQQLQQAVQPFRAVTQNVTQRQADVRVAGQAAMRQPLTGIESVDALRNQQIDAYHSMLNDRLEQEKAFVMASREQAVQWARQQEDAQIQVGRATEDFNRQRYRQQRDFNIQMERMAEDNAKALYDPYQRIAQQSYWDTASLLSNIGEQNQAIARQTAQVRQLRRMGISQQAVDTLGLMDPKNAAQVAQMVGDLAANPAYVRQINAEVNQRVKASRDATLNENNVQYRRATDDFKRGMHDAADDFHRQLGRMNADLVRSHTRAQQDLARMYTEYSGDIKQITTDFMGALAALPASATKVMSTNLTTMKNEAWKVAGEAMAIQNGPYGPTITIVMPTQEQVAPHVSEHSGPGAGPGTGAGPNTFRAPSVGTVRGTLPHNVQEAFAFAAKEDQHASHNWHGMCDNFVAQAYGLSHSGYATAKAHWNAIPAGYKGGGTPPPGALVFWHNGSAGHAALSIGGGMVYSTDFVRDGQVDPTEISSINRQWGGYSGWSIPFFGGKTAPIAMAEGGLAVRHGMYELAERGRGEAVIPLNERGARVLAETMVRYVDQSKVAAARTAPYATHISHGGSYTYDQRVMVTGPVTVPAEDPMGFARKMEDRARQARLVQPVGRP